MFASTMICWRSLLGTVQRAAERSTSKLMSHGAHDRHVFERRRYRLARSGWRAFNLASRPARIRRA